jgi:hypothetical protein
VFLKELERPALKPLPTVPYVFAERQVRGVDYHVDVEHHFCSIPYRFARGGSRFRSPALPWGSSRRARRIDFADRRRNVGRTGAVAA